MSTKCCIRCIRKYAAATARWPLLPRGKAWWTRKDAAPANSQKWLQQLAATSLTISTRLCQLMRSALQFKGIIDSAYKFSRDLPPRELPKWEKYLLYHDVTLTIWYCVLGFQPKTGSLAFIFSTKNEQSVTEWIKIKCWENTISPVRLSPCWSG